jgi:tetratricopeptide (TPR) repeat protein
MLALVVGWGLGGDSLLAQQDGQDDLVKARELKLEAKTLTDLGEVIRLCESALKKGLDQDSAEQANLLLSATLIQRGSQVARMVFEDRSDPKWPAFRERALEDLERAVKLDPKQPEAYFRIAQLHLLPGGDAKRAAEALDRSIEVNQQDSPLKAQALLIRAALQKDPAKKLADLDQAAQAAPGDPSPLRARGMFHAQQGKFEQALADFDAALAIDPRHPETLEAKAATLGRLKRYDEALALLDRALKLDPDSVGPLVERARVHEMQENLQAALDDLNEADRRDPGNPVVLLLRANVYRQREEDDKALADVDAVLRLRPGLDMAMRFRAGLLADQGKYADAIRQIEELLAKSPDDVDSRIQLAYLYSLDRKHEKTIEIFSRILEKDPGNFSALRGRADTYLGIGKHAEAIADYEKALKLRPDDSGILNNFAWVLATSPFDHLRNGKRAIELAERACKLTDYQQAHILSTLGAAYAESGDFATAMKWSQKAIELGRDDQKEALQKELDSYKAKKPFRELKTGDEPEERPKPRKRSPPKSPK